MAKLNEVFSEAFLSRLNSEQFNNLKERTESANDTDVRMAMSMHENARHDWLLTDDSDLRTKILQEDGTLYRFGQVRHEDYVREPGWINAVSILSTEFTAKALELQSQAVRR